MNPISPTHLEDIQPFGHVQSIKVSDTTSILTPGSGFIKEYDFSLNAYTGCSFGCAYCYVPMIRFRGPHRKEHGEWGEYVHLKRNAIAVIKRQTPKLTGKTVYMSPVTDPYQPVEKKAEITRGVLAVLVGSGVQLTVQTRSPLVVRDMDLLKELRARVYFTISTDDPEWKSRYERFCPSNTARFKAIRTLTDAGITVVATCCPLFPLLDPLAFADRIKEVGVSWAVIQKPHDHKVGATTPALVLAELKAHGWTHDEYRRVYDLLVERFAPLPVYEEKVGFQPIVPHLSIELLA